MVMEAGDGVVIERDQSCTGDVEQEWWGGEGRGRAGSGRQSAMGRLSAA
jgi:hypothetical protein